jgi:NitT/TauT family transport system substrate-binding protein
VVGACAILLSGCQGDVVERRDAQGQPVVSIRSAAPSLTTAVALTMMSEETYKAHGLNVEYDAFGTSSTIPVQAVLTGHSPYGSASALTVLHAIRHGARLKIIAGIVNNTQVMTIRNDVLARKGVSPDAPIAERVRALKGLTVASGSPGSFHYQMLRSYLTYYGLDPDRDVTIIGVNEPSALIAGLEQHRFDAIAYASPIVERAISQGLATLWISCPRGDMPPFTEITTSVIFARTDYIESHRAEVDAMVASLQDGLDALKADRTSVGEILHRDYFPRLDKQVWDLAWANTRNAYPDTVAFTPEAYDYWTENDPAGPESYAHLDHSKVTYDPA